MQGSNDYDRLDDTTGANLRSLGISLLQVDYLNGFRELLESIPRLETLSLCLIGYEAFEADHVWVFLQSPLVTGLTSLNITAAAMFGLGLSQGFIAMIQSRPEGGGRPPLRAVTAREVIRPNDDVQEAFDTLSREGMIGEIIVASDD